MKKQHFSILINAPKEKVWKVMLEDETYREWTKAFNPSGKGGYYEGEWKTGSDMRFIGPEDDGSVSGMLSKVVEARPPEYISLRHVGEVIRGKERKYDNSDFFENYTLTDKDGGTEVSVDLNLLDEYGDMFNDSWPKALQKLKEVAEQ